MVAQLGTSMLSGGLATRFGRQPVLCVGVAFVAIGPMLFAVVPDVFPQQVRMISPQFLVCSRRCEENVEFTLCFLDIFH